MQEGVLRRWFSLLSAGVVALSQSTHAPAQGPVASPPAVSSPAVPPTLAGVFQSAVESAISDGYISKPGHFSGQHPQSLDAVVCAGNTYLIIVAAVPPMGSPPFINGSTSGEIRPLSVETDGAIVRILFEATTSERLQIKLPGPAPEQRLHERQMLAAVLYK